MKIERVWYREEEDERNRGRQRRWTLLLSAQTSLIHYDPSRTANPIKHNSIRRDWWDHLTLITTLHHRSVSCESSFLVVSNACWEITQDSQDSTTRNTMREMGFLHDLRVISYLMQNNMSENRRLLVGCWDRFWNKQEQNAAEYILSPQTGFIHSTGTNGEPGEASAIIIIIIIIIIMGSSKKKQGACFSEWDINRLKWCYSFVSLAEPHNNNLW